MTPRTKKIERTLKKEMRKVINNLMKVKMDN